MPKQSELAPWMTVWAHSSIIIKYSNWTVVWSIKFNKSSGWMLKESIFWASIRQNFIELTCFRHSIVHIWLYSSNSTVDIRLSVSSWPEIINVGLAAWANVGFSGVAIVSSFMETAIELSNWLKIPMFRDKFSFDAVKTDWNFQLKQFNIT